MVNSDTHQEEYHGSQDIDPEKHTLDYRFCRCRRITLRLLPLSNAHRGSPLQLRACGLVSGSLWTHLLTLTANFPTIQPREFTSPLSLCFVVFSSHSWRRGACSTSFKAIRVL